MIKQEGKLGKFPLFHPSDHLIQRSISLVMIMRYHLFQLLVLLLVTTAKSTTTRSSILRTAAANQKANKKASLHAEFDEWLKTKSIDSSKKNVDFNTNKMDATTLLEVNVDGQTSSQSSGISDLAHTISDIKEVNTFFQDCDAKCIENNINTLCVFQPDGEKLSITSMLENFANTAISQNDGGGQGGLVTAFHGLVCGFVMNGVDMLSSGFGIMKALEAKWEKMKMTVSVIKCHSLQSKILSKCSCTGILIQTYLFFNFFLYFSSLCDATCYW